MYDYYLLQKLLNKTKIKINKRNFAPKIHRKTALFSEFQNINQRIFILLH